MGYTELIQDLKERDLMSLAISIEESISEGSMGVPKTKLTHHFADGVYVREMFLPKGTVIVGKKHRYRCINIMIKGDITIYADGDQERFIDHYIGVAPVGTQKAALVNEDTIWLCIHATNKTDLDEIEEEAIISDREGIKTIEKIRCLRGKS